MNENYFMGLDGFVWFIGVVENRNDPAKLGRVQVRCLGYHTENLIDIPSADLPWAHVMMPGKSALYHICMRGHGKMIPRELQDVLNTKWLKFGRIAFWQRVLTNAVVMIAFTAWTMLDTGPDSWDCCGGGSSGSGRRGWWHQIRGHRHADGDGRVEG